MKNDYTYKYDYRINTFPEEVFLHEFLHTLERNSIEAGYEVPELHDYNQYGYEEERLIGLKRWYEDYMSCKIFDKTTNTYIGLNEIVYTLTPPHASNFNYSIELEFSKEPQNILEEIKSLVNVVLKAI